MAGVLVFPRIARAITELHFLVHTFLMCLLFQNVEVVPNPTETVTSHQPAVRSVSMYAVASENGTLKKSE